MTPSDRPAFRYALPAAATADVNSHISRTTKAKRSNIEAILWISIEPIDKETLSRPPFA